MSFLNVIRALGRRWYVTLAGLLVTGALAWTVTDMVPPVYTARALVLLVPSEQAVGKGGNPFLALGGLDLPARVVVAYYESDVARTRFASQSSDGEYVVAIEESTRGPVIAVDVTDATPQQTLATLDRITESIPVELQRLQEEVDAPPKSVVTTLLLAKDEKAQTDSGGTVRLLIAATAAGLVGTGVVAVALDGMLRSRRARAAAVLRARASAEPAQPAGASSPPAVAPRPLLPRLIQERPTSVPPEWRNPRLDDAQEPAATESR
ncbi:hypothetical protein [Promicromonospora soli]